jgi:hemolysin-activating ACP:hemolysin acyltransferase
MSRGCSLPNYTGTSLEPVFRINFGETVIRECPISYCDWTYVNDAVTSYQLYEDKWLPEPYDEYSNRPLGILDQTEFFYESARIVKNIQNKFEAETMKNLNKSTK